MVLADALDAAVRAGEVPRREEVPARPVDAAERQVGVGADQAGGQTGARVAVAEVGLCGRRGVLGAAGEVGELGPGDVARRALGEGRGGPRRPPRGERRRHERHEGAEGQGRAGGVFGARRGRWRGRRTRAARVGRLGRALGDAPGAAEALGARDAPLRAEDLHAAGRDAPLPRGLRRRHPAHDPSIPSVSLPPIIPETDSRTRTLRRGGGFVTPP